MKKNNISKIVGLIAIVFIAIFVWYSPVLFKGYAKAPGENHILARNLIKTGRFSLENEKNVILASELISENGVPSPKGDKLTSLISAGIYKIAGLPNENSTILLSVIISALALLFFFLTVWKIFDYLTALIFAGIYIFLPVIWGTSIGSNSYEYSFLFLSLAFLVFFSKWNKFKIIKYVISGIFLALSFLCKDAMALFAPALFIWMWIYRRKRILPLFISMLVTIIIFIGVNQIAMGSSVNNHLVLLGGDESVSGKKDFFTIGHFYPDPYTYHYEKDEYISKKINEINKGGVNSFRAEKSMSNIEPGYSSFLKKLKVMPFLLIGHLSSIISLESIGGPFIIFFFMMGLWFLSRDRKDITSLMLLWIGFVFLLCSIVFLSGRNHVMDFAFAFALGVGAGTIYLAKQLSEKITIHNKIISYKYWAMLLLALIIYQLILSSHIAFSREYDNNNFLKLKAYQDKIMESNIGADDIIATPFRNEDIWSINYLTDKSFVKFDSNTVAELISKNKLDFAFKEFGVTKVVGYSSEITEEILKNSSTVNIADNSIKTKEISTSPAKSFFMGLIR